MMNRPDFTELDDDEGDEEEKFWNLPYRGVKSKILGVAKTSSEMDRWRLSDLKIVSKFFMHFSFSGAIVVVFSG